MPFVPNLEGVTRMRVLINLGLSNTQIAGELNCCKRTITRWRRKIEREEAGIFSDTAQIA